jgi:hypothetical protein
MYLEHDLFGKPVPTERVKPEAMLFRIMLCDGTDRGAGRLSGHEGTPPQTIGARHGIVDGARGQPRRWHVRLVRSPDLALLLRLMARRHGQREVVKKVTFTLLLTDLIPFSRFIRVPVKALLTSLDNRRSRVLPYGIPMGEPDG